MDNRLKGAGLVFACLLFLGWGVSPVSASSRTSAAAIGNVDLKATYQLTGAVSKHASFVNEILAASCAYVGSHGTGVAFVGGPARFGVPSPPPPSGNAENIDFTAGVSPYKGPGTYTKADILKSGGTDIIVGSGMYNAVAKTASAAMTVHANGSGSFTFSKATPFKPGPTLSGKVTWTCGT